MEMVGWLGSRRLQNTGNQPQFFLYYRVLKVSEYCEVTVEAFAFLPKRKRS